jgi:hypothetical protein
MQNSQETTGNLMEQEKQRHQFQWRSFTTFYVVLSFIIITLSGIILFITPPGRVAYWSQWQFLWLTKQQWQAVHTIFTFLFVVAGSFHLFFNWKVIITYMRVKLDEGMKRRNELLLSSTIAFLVLALTLANVPPFKTVMDFGEEARNSWVSPKDEPPIPHAELLTLTQFAEKAQIPLKQIEAQLAAAGIVADSTTMSVKLIAEKHNLTPQQLYAKMQKGSPQKIVQVAEGGGYGRKTIAQVCDQLNVTLPEGLRRLQASGILADESNNVRDLAAKAGKSPIDIVKIIGGETAQ